MGYLKTVITGLSWASALRVTIRLLAIGKTAILARLLLPEQFGAFGVAAMALAFLEILTETGINVVLLQQKGDLGEYIDTAWVISIFRGMVISLAMLGSASFIAGFFASPDSFQLLLLAAAIPLIRGFINPANVVFLKDLRFDREFWYRAIILGAEILVTVVVAWQTRSAASFVWGLILAAVTEVVLSFAFISPRPKLKFEKQKLAHVINRGKWVTGFGIFDYVFTQGDNIVAGRLLGEGALGIYRAAYSLSTLPVTEISEIYYKVTFPVYVKVADDPKRLRAMVLRSVSVLWLGLLVAGIVVFLLARPLVLVVLGTRWSMAIPVVQVLALMGVCRGLAFSFNSFFVALEKQKYVTVIIATGMVGLMVSIVPLVSQFGLLGAGYSAALGSILSLPVAVYLVLKSLRSYGRAG